MNIYIILSIVVTLVAIISLITIISLNKLKKYKEIMNKAENNIENCLEKKLDLIIAINTEVKKVVTEKDYLKDYITIKDLIISNIEKDIKLDEATTLIYKLLNDYTKLNSSQKLKKEIEELKHNNEKLISSKNIFNKNALISNNLIKNFPNNIFAKIFNYKIRSYYNNKAEGQDNF